MSGRVVDIAVANVPEAGRLGTVVYIAAATGGVWKSTSAGVAWRPVLDDAGVGSMGDVTVAPSNPAIVWAGSGEPNNMRSSSYGNGVYRSLDGGDSFEHMGLETSQHIGRILIHPSDPHTVFVAAVGRLWGAGGDRGVFKTTDGGESWTPSLVIDEHTGVTDIVMDPRDPDILYASSLQRERRAYSYVGGGPGSGIHKSTDGGRTWTRLTRGLPSSDMGRIGLDISLSRPETVYAVIEGSEQGVYRTDDGGFSWRKMSDIASIPWYFGQIRVDPKDPETVYHLGVPLQRSLDGGRSWERIARSVHVDHHAMWINPEDPSHIFLGNDGGFYASHDRGETWDFSPNLPISQFYAVGIDEREPFFGIYGGLQDNSTWGGPSRTRNSMGIGNADWYRMAGGDGFYAAIDPSDPDIAYVESQNGNLLRYNRRTGERKSIRPRPDPGEEAYRFNWSSPVQISPFDPATVYFAGNHVFRSNDRGNSWTVLGEDLTRSIDRDSLPMMGAIPSDDAVSRHQGTAVFSNISTMHLSSLREGLIATGTDDGTISVSMDDGASWTKGTRFPGVPDTTYVSRVRWSRHDESTLYATLDGHRSNDFRPYVLKSADYGESWTSIAGDLPEFGNVRAFAEHPGNPNLLFVGTEIRPFASIDGGRTWLPLENGVPPSPVHDIKVHERDNALVIATHGRGFFIVDDLAPLEHLAEARAAEAPFLFPVEDALMYVANGSATTGTHADRDYSAPNPEYGAAIHVLAPAGGGGASVVILDAGGETLRKLDVPSGSGLRSIQWDLTGEAAWQGPPAQGGRGSQSAAFGGGFGGSQGVFALPGRYVAQLVSEDGEVLGQEEFRVLKDELIDASDTELARLRELRLAHRALSARTAMAIRQTEALDQEADQIKAALQTLSSTHPAATLEEERGRLQAQAKAALEALRGPAGGGGFGSLDPDEPESIRRMLLGANGVHQAFSPATTQERAALERARAALPEQISAVAELLESFEALRRSLDDAGAPWTPGRPIG